MVDRYLSRKSGDNSFDGFCEKDGRWCHSIGSPEMKNNQLDDKLRQKYQQNDTIIKSMQSCKSCILCIQECH